MKLKILFITLISVLLINPVLAAEKMTQKDMSEQQRKMGSCHFKATQQSLTGEKENPLCNPAFVIKKISKMKE